MPIPGVEQPRVLPIDNTLRLRKYGGIVDFAYPWYQDPETVYLVDGVRTPYTWEKLRRMYGWLDAHGELYFIETPEGGSFRPIGDVTFWQGDMPIVIGNPDYRGKGIGKKVISALIRRGKQLGFDRLYVNEIYDYNTDSRKCFESVGFRACEKTEKGNRFQLLL